jgi:uncharacterized protein (DUF1501 family)
MKTPHSRRRFLRASIALGTCAGAQAWWGAPALAAPAATAGAAPQPGNLFVMVYLKGGNDAFNTFVPLRDANYRRYRPSLAIAPEHTIPFSATHGFNLALKPLLPAWEHEQMALLQGIGQQDVTNQHYRDLEAQFTGSSPDEYRADGWVSRALSPTAPMPSARVAPDQALDGFSGAIPLHALAFGDLDIRLADPFGPFRGNRLRVVNIEHPSEWLASRAIAATRHNANAPAARLTGWRSQPATLDTRFPADEFGDALRAIAEMAAVGHAPRVAHVTLNASNGDHHDAFDTHWDQARHHGPTLERLAGGLAAFRAAMIEIGRWNETLVVTYDEFGRSPRENERKGTHHGWASTHLAMGGRVKGGLLGKAPESTNVFSISGPPPVIDTRELYATVIERWWGLSSAGVFERRFKPLDLLRA